MVTKSVARRSQHALAGRRIPMPGHSRAREEKLRAELADHFGPAGAVEVMWVNDVAWCCASIEVIRAQIAAVRLQQLSDACQSRHAFTDLPFVSEVLGDTPPVEQENREALEDLKDANFVAAPGASLLDNDLFALVLGSFSREQAVQLTMLQHSLHEELRERDRIIKQISRMRREAMRHAVEMTEAGQRAKKEGYVVAGLSEYLAALPGSSAAPDTDLPGGDVGEACIESEDDARGAES